VVSVSWTPATTGSMSGKVTFKDSGPKSPQTVSLTGVGVTPAVSLSQSNLVFATEVVFTSSAMQMVKLTNTGLGILSIAKISITGPFTETNTCGNSVAAGNTCTLTVIFKPITIGTLTGAVSIADNAPPRETLIKLFVFHSR
jgi:hypothetical protein